MALEDPAASTAGKGTYTAAIEDSTNYIAWIIASFRGHFGKRLAEVGIGHGGYFPYLPPLQSYVGVDIDAELVERARTRRPGLDYLRADVTTPEFAAEMARREVDTILCVNVLEHIPDDGLAISSLLNALPPGGKLLLFVPALPSLYSHMDRLAGHFRRYTKATLAAVIAPAGGRVLRMTYFNAVGGVGWWANKLVKHQDLNNTAVNAQMRLFDRLLVPVARAVDPLTSSFFGQSLVCVVEKT